MTPEEKSEQIVDKYLDILPSRNSIMYIPDVETAQKCALIAVDDIIQTLNYDIRDLDVRGSVLIDLIEYWREVKQEIEKL